MQDASISLTRAAAYTLWVLVIAKTVTAAMLLGFGYFRPGAALSIVSAVSAIAASTVSCRCYALRVARLVRVVGSLETGDDEPPRSIRSLR